MCVYRDYSRKKRSKRRILLFARVPQKGQVKTRLAEKLGQEVVLHLYMLFVEDILETIAKGGYHPIVCYHPSKDRSKMTDWLGKSIDFQPQTGETLGERMHNAFYQVFSKGVERAVLIGTDFPDLDIGIVDEAFAALEKKDMIIGPAADGGYYLIGFRKTSFNSNIFMDIPWGTEVVFEKTVRLMDYEGLSRRTLPVGQDIDTFDDLAAFYRRCKEKKLFHLKTIQYLSKILKSCHDFRDRDSI